MNLYIEMRNTAYEPIYRNEEYCYVKTALISVEISMIDLVFNVPVGNILLLFSGSG